MTHTQGPWKARTHDRLDDLIIGADGEIVAHLYEERDREEVEANFALIAAAPDMLEALEAFTNDPDIAYELAENAIAKARGTNA